MIIVEETIRNMIVVAGCMKKWDSGIMRNK